MLSKGKNSQLVLLGAFTKGTAGQAARTAASIAAEMGGAVLIPTIGYVYQDRSVTPSVPAGYGDPVGTIVGQDGSYFAVAASDAERCTLTLDLYNGKPYLENGAAGDIGRYICKDASNNNLVFTNGYHTAVIAVQGATSNKYYGWGDFDFRTSAGVGTASSSAAVVRNAANGTNIGVKTAALGDLPHVFSLWFKDDPVGIVDGHQDLTSTGAVYADPTRSNGLVIMARANNIKGNGPRRYYGGVFVPGVMSSEDELICRAEMNELVRGPVTPVSPNLITLDFANDLFSWDGVSKTIGDLTNTSGVYSLDIEDHAGRELLFSVDVLIPDNDLHDSFRTMARLTDGVHALTFETPDTPNNTLRFRNESFAFAPIAWTQVSAGNGAPTEGLLRCVLYMKPGQKMQIHGGGYMSSPYEYNAIFTPNLRNLTVEADADFGIGTVQAVRIKGGVFTQAQVAAFCNEGIAEAVFCVGDSFMDSGAVDKAITKQTGFYGFVGLDKVAVGGVGWDVLTPLYLAKDAETFDRTLVMLNGADEYDISEAAGIGYIQSMIDALTHERFLYLESNPINPIGDSRRTDWETRQAVYKAIPDMAGHYVDTLECLQANHDDTSTDLDPVALGLWAESNSFNGDDDVHPGVKGQEVYGRIAVAEMALRGWFDPGKGPTVTEPDAPTDVVRTDNELKWEYPADDGNYPVSGWNLYVDDVLTYSGALRRFDVSAIEPGTYAITITAVNKVGESLPVSYELVIVAPVPSAAGALEDQNYFTGTGSQTYDVSGDFTNAIFGSWSVEGPAGVTIDSNGVVTTTTTVAKFDTVTVTYTNGSGSASSSYTLYVAETVTANHIINGGMDADSDWTKSITGTGVGITISGGVMTIDGNLNANGTAYAYQAIPTIIGENYTAIFDRPAGNAGYFKVGTAANGTQLGSSLSSIATNITVNFTATTTTTYITMTHQNNAGANPQFDNVRVNGPMTVPVAGDNLADQFYVGGTGDQTINAYTDFAGTVAGTWSVTGPSGVTINQSGVVTVPTGTDISGLVTVTYTNAAGSAESTFNVEVVNYANAQIGSLRQVVVYRQGGQARIGSLSRAVVYRQGGQARIGSIRRAVFYRT